MPSPSHEFLALLGYLFLRYGQASKAAVVLESLTILEPSAVNVRRTLGYARLLSGDAAACLAELDLLRNLDGGRELFDERGTQLIRSRALWALGRKDESRRIVQGLQLNRRGDHGVR